MTLRESLSVGMRAGALALLLATGMLTLAMPAAAHSAIEPSAVEAGVSTTFTLTIAHGCAPGEPPPGPGETTSPTTEVSLRLPPDAVVDGASAPDGWEVATAMEDGRAIVNWSGGTLAPEDAGDFSFTATLYGDEGDTVPVEVFQGCVEGSYRWVEVPPEPQDGDDSASDGDEEPLEQPAPLVELLTSARAPTPSPTAPAVDPTTPDADPAATETAPAATASATTPEPTPAAVPEPSATAGDDEPDDDGGSSTAVVAALIVIALGALAFGAIRGGGAQ